MNNTQVIKQKKKLAKKKARKQKITRQAQGKPVEQKNLKQRGFTNENRPRRQPGEGTRENVMIEANLVPAAVEGMPLAVVTMGYTRGWFTRPTSPPMFFAYWAALLDLQAILKNQQIPIVGRPAYLNRILEAYKPKSVQFKTGEVIYTFTGVDNINFNPEFDVRSYTFYMYEPSSAVNAGGWLTQTAPLTPTNPADTYLALTNLFGLLASSDKPGTVYTPITVEDPHYKYDVSPMASVDEYYGAVNAPGCGGCAASAECEVAFKSPIMANLVPYVKTNGRTARKFKFSSGDSTAAYGFGYLPTFDVINYDTTYPPIYKFIDLDEVNQYLQNWMINAISVAIPTFPGVSSQVSLGTSLIGALTQFNYSPQQWRIALRQCILSMFADSQSLGQFMTYHTVRGNFEALRCGSNCYPGQIQQKLLIPSALNENLRCLLAAKYNIPSKFPAKKNKLFIIPVWGVYSNAEIPFAVGPFLDQEGGSTYGELFTGSVDNDPNVIDGVDSQDNVCDLNESSFVPNIIAEWNYRVNLLQTVCGITGPMGGTSNGSLLNFTRVAEYPEERDKKRDVSTISKFMLPALHKKYFKTEKVGTGKTVKDVTYYVPPDASLYGQETVKYTSICTITETMKQALQYYILPSIVVTTRTQDAPTVREYRIANLETNICEFPKLKNTITSRGFEIFLAAGRAVSGTAAAMNDELSAVVQTRNENGLGGFLGDVLGAFGATLPF